MRLPVRRRRAPRDIHRAEPFMIAAADASRRIGHDYIGTEHLLLSLAEDHDGAAARALTGAGLSGTAVQAEIVRIVGLCERPHGRLDAGALATLGIDLDEVRRQADDAFGPGALERTSAGCSRCCRA
jgi:ATP-dependent Clp protease ATP-binding subunit ClpA